jgi:CDGSH-type Zn-finger protein
MSGEKIRITLIPNGPAQVENGNFEIVLPDGETKEKEAPFALCRCGASKRKPFCDGSHKTTDFQG